MKKIIVFFFLGTICFQYSSCIRQTAQPDFAAQLKSDLAQIDTYLATHGIPAIKDSSVRYTIQVMGTGAKPSLSGNVSVKYSASTLGSSQVFDQSQGAVFVLNTLIAGWQIALPDIPKGSTFTLYIPSGLAYGNTGAGPVPPNANVVYTIELLDDDAQLVADKGAIDAYLDSIGAANVHKDSSGIRFIYIGNPGTGPKPTANSTVSVTYVGKLFKSNAVFDSQSAAVQFVLTGVIKGWQIGLQLIPAGSSITLYIPSGLAYGPASQADGATPIPPNSILVFDIDLISTN